MLPVDFLAKEGHFADHIVPVWRALPPDARGFCYVGGNLPTEYFVRLGIPRHCVMAEHHPSFRQRAGLVLTAAIADARYARQHGRAAVLYDHGAGQSYSGVQASYAGGGDRAGIVLQFAPNVMAQQRNLQAHPEIPCIVVGCAKLDPWHNAPPKPRNTPPVVCISFHWQCRVAPESMGAFDYYRDIIPSLTRQGYTLIGHAHPRMQSVAFPFYRKHHIPCVRDFSEVLTRADCYVIDNSSTLFEFASLDRPVVVLNAPWYRRTIHHGLRFWEYADVGVIVDTPRELPAAILRALDDPADVAARRREIIGHVYPYRGDAAARTARAIVQAAQELAMRRKAENTMDTTVTMINQRRYHVYNGHPYRKGQEMEVNNCDVERLEKSKWAVRSTAPVATPAVGPQENTERGRVGPTEGKPLLPSEDKDSIGVTRGVILNYPCPLCGKISHSRIGHSSHLRSCERKTPDERQAAAGGV